MPDRRPNDEWTSPRSKKGVRIPPALQNLFASFGAQVVEVLNNSVEEALYSAVDDGLSRVESKIQEGLGRIKKARGRAQERKRRK
jgi:hypothetical protein